MVSERGGRSQDGLLKPVSPLSKKVQCSSGAINLSLGRAENVPVVTLRRVLYVYTTSGILGTFLGWGVLILL